MPTTALINQMAIFYTSELDFQILHMLFVCWQLMRYLYLCKIKNAGSNENYSSACSLWGLACSRWSNMRLHCSSLFLDAQRQSSVVTGFLLLILMALWGVWACYCRWTAVHPNDLAMLLSYRQARRSNSSPGIWRWGKICLIYTCVGTYRSPIAWCSHHRPCCCHVTLALERDVAWCVETDVDLIYDKTETWKRQPPKRSNNLMFTNVMKSSFGVHASTCHALK